MRRYIIAAAIGTALGFMLLVALGTQASLQWYWQFLFPPDFPYNSWAVNCQKIDRLSNQGFWLLFCLKLLEYSPSCVPLPVLMSVFCLYLWDRRKANNPIIRHPGGSAAQRR